MSPTITASMLYDLVACPHRLSMDLFGDVAMRDKPNSFVQLLWEKGSVFEDQVVKGLQIPFVDLSTYAGDEKERLTLEAMQRGESLIYSGRVCDGDLVGEPDLLRKEAGGYIAGDIKSGAGEEGHEDLSKPKAHYAVQVALYTDILERKGLSAGRRAFIWDVHGKEVIYDFTELYGKRNPKTLWQDYEECIREARSIVQNRNSTMPAYSSVCKLCHWYSACIDRLTKDDDLTLIAELGRSKRDEMISRIRTVSELAAIDVQTFVIGKKTIFSGVGPDSLIKFSERAKLLKAKNAKPLLFSPIRFPDNELELFFDIEVDPMRDICYLHGFIERRGYNNATETFKYFFAENATAEAEKSAFIAAWHYLNASHPCTIYYYSKYERTIYRKLQEKYPDVCTAKEIEDLFNPTSAIDLYSDVVKKATEWPTRDFSIKTLATFLGFEWRDTHPSGAASIEWFDQWIKTGDVKIRQRILDYNEDDCIATRVLLDQIKHMAAGS